MNWKKYFIVLMTLGSTFPAFAIDKPGFYVAAGMALDATTAEDFGFVQEDSAPSATLTDAGRTKLFGTLIIGYYAPLGPKYGVMIETGKEAGGGIGFTTAAVLSANSGYTSQIDREWQFKRDWFFSIKPALRLSDTTLAYLSLSHHQSSVSGRSDLYIDCLLDCGTISSFSGGGNLSGTGTGLGMQTTIEKIWFLRVEVEGIRFNQFTANTVGLASGTLFGTQSLHPKSTIGRVMVGYRF